MEKSMTTSAMTDGQINRAVEIFKAKLVKHQAEFPSDAVQIVFGQSELAEEWLAVLRKRVEVVSNIIVRHVRVDRRRTPQQVLDATGRRQYTNKDVVGNMPKGTDEEVDVYFFKVGCFLSDNVLDEEYKLRGLIPADPYSQAAVNEADPAFADQYPNGTHWKDSKGRWCFVTFSRWYDAREVNVHRLANGWHGLWWLAGLRK